jgi:hypothetical protein
MVENRGLNSRKKPADTCKHGSNPARIDLIEIDRPTHAENFALPLSFAPFSSSHPWLKHKHSLSAWTNSFSSNPHNCNKQFLDLFGSLVLVGALGKAFKKHFSGCQLA